jgi:predicted nucleic-acid-binding protein
VLCELIWVLSRGYHFGRAEIAAVVSSLLTSNDIVLEDSEQVRVALLSFQSGGLGFADALMGEVNRVHGCEATATFDRKAARLGGFVLV